MRSSPWSPSVLPADDETVYLVVDDFGKLGRWREADTETTDLENIITDLLEGQYKNPVRVVGFNIVKASILDGASPVAIARALRRLRIVVEWNVVPNRRFSY
jgi:hypothetical protein